MENENEVRDYVRLVWTQAHRILGPGVARDLRDRDLWADLGQVVALAVLMAERGGLDVAATGALAAREVRDALRGLGYAHPRGSGYTRLETGYDMDACSSPRAVSSGNRRLVARRLED